MTESERFWSRVVKTDTCWLWQGKPAKKRGYGQFKSKGKNWRAHRWAFLEAYGYLPEPPLGLDHTCHTDQCAGGDECPHRLCVRPDHLKPSTARDNVLRSTSPAAMNHRKAACHRGHVFSEENTLVLTNGDRVCRECQRIRGRKADAKRRAKRREEATRV